MCRASLIVCLPSSRPVRPFFASSRYRSHSSSTVMALLLDGDGLVIEFALFGWIVDRPLVAIFVSCSDRYRV